MPAGPVGLETRRAALAALSLVLDKGQPLDEVLVGLGALQRMAPRDRGFVRTLLGAVLRRLGSLDAVIDHCLARPEALRDTQPRHLLRLGAAQLLLLGTPPHAALATSLALASQGRLAPYKAVIAAVLHRLAREGGPLLEALDGPRLDTPAWLWDAWAAAHGEATARALALAHAGEAALDLTVREDAAGWAERLGARLLPTGSLRLTGGGAIDALPGFAAGAWWVQDAAAALPARLLGPVSGRRVFDLCAAPGGKTAQLAAAGARVTAVDRSAARLGRLEANLRRLGLEAEIVAADATEWQADQPADAALLDAPCSATGTIRRHPDVPWQKRLEDLAVLTALQDRLLAQAARLVRPGGTLVFCTCSLQPEEGARRIEAALAAGLPLARRPIVAEEVPALAGALTADGDLRTLPCHWPDLGGLDGFFVARLERLAG